MGTHHPLRVFSGSANRPLADAVVRILEEIRLKQITIRVQQDLDVSGMREPVALGCATTTALPDSEIHVLIDQVVRDQDVFHHSTVQPPRQRQPDGIAPVY